MFQTMTIYLPFGLGNSVLLQFWTIIPLSSDEIAQAARILNSFVFMRLTWDKKDSLAGISK